MLVRQMSALIALLLLAAGCSDVEGEDDGARGGSGADVACTAFDLGEDDTVEFVSAYRIDAGVFGEPCFGDANDTLEEAWDLLAAMTPADQLRDLALFAGFRDLEDGEEVTEAFVNAVDPDDGSLFQLSINLETLDLESDAFLLTLAHEFSHVFTATAPQLDRDVDADDCPTYYSGEGCYTDDSVMAQWIELFWGDGLIDEIDPDEEATVAAGEQRCSLEPRFLGSYAASNPEEDFAETFAAYVLRVEVDGDELQDKLDWIDEQPGLREFQELAAAAGLGPAANSFEGCG